jgi:uncharacterized protein YqgC (DUF456 family)
MQWLSYVVAFMFVLSGVGCLALVVIQLPGGWLLLALAVCVEFFVDPLYLSPESQPTFPSWTLWTSLALLLVGEAVEFGASVLGAKQGGATRRGMIGSLIGGFAGAILLTPVIPVPVVGTLVGALVGTFLGAVAGEITGQEPSSLPGSIKPATGATVGRVLGSMSKLGIALAMWMVLSVAAFWR